VLCSRPPGTAYAGPAMTTRPTRRSVGPATPIARSSWTSRRGARCGWRATPTTRSSTGTLARAAREPEVPAALRRPWTLLDLQFSAVALETGERHSSSEGVRDAVEQQGEPVWAALGSPGDPTRPCVSEGLRATPRNPWWAVWGSNPRTGGRPRPRVSTPAAGPRARTAGHSAEQRGPRRVPGAPRLGPRLGVPPVSARIAHAAQRNERN